MINVPIKIPAPRPNNPKNRMPIQEGIHCMNENEYKLTRFAKVIPAAMQFSYK